MSDPRKTAAEKNAGSRPWIVVALLFFVALINYFDRQSLSVVAPRFQAELHMSDEGYGHIVSLFLLASTFAYALSGFLTDALGTRRSMAIFVGWWSLAEAVTSFAHSILQLRLARFCLGLGEPGLWVAAPKVVGETIKKDKRGLAIGIYTMGATVGAVVAIPTIAAVTSHLPWKAIFLIDGCAGLLWLPFWFYLYRNRQTAPVIPQPSTAGAWRDVLTRGTTWRLMIARGLTDPVWYFYLFWFPKYLLSARHLSLPQMARIGWIVYLAAGIGTLLGGLFSGMLILRGMTAGMAYRRAMLCSAVLIPLSPFVSLAHTAALAIALAALIALAHMAWLVNLTSTIVELFPSHQVGSAAGLIAAGSGFGGMLSSELIAHFVSRQGYGPVFCFMAFLHPLGLAILWTVFRTRVQPQRPPEMSLQSVRIQGEI